MGVAARGRRLPFQTSKERCVMSTMTEQRIRAGERYRRALAELRTASLTFARSRRPSGGKGPNRPHGIAASIASGLSTGFPWPRHSCGVTLQPQIKSKLGTLRCPVGLASQGGRGRESGASDRYSDPPKAKTPPQASYERLEHGPGPPASSWRVLHATIF
jgi:hypothetical protein